MQGTQVRPRGQREPGARRRCLDSKLVGIGAVGSQGISVALSADSNTAILGARNDILAPGTAWLFVQQVATVLPYLQRAARDRPTPNHHPFDLVSSFTLSNTHVRRFRYGGIEAYV